MTKNTVTPFAASTGTPTTEAPRLQGYNEPTERLLRRPEVCHLTSIPSSSLTDLINKGSFPAPYKLSERMAAWKLSEIMTWINSRQRSAQGG